MNFKVPQHDGDFDYYGNSSQDESRGSQGRLFVFQHEIKGSVGFYACKYTFFTLVLFIRLENWWLKELGLKIL